MGFSYGGASVRGAENDDGDNCSTGIVRTRCGRRAAGPSADWSRAWNPPFSTADSATASRTDSTQAKNGDNQSRVAPENDEEPETASDDARPPSEPIELRTVDVELIWTRFEKEGSGQLLSTQEGDDATLSVCMVISWPPHDLIDRAAEFASTGQTLQSLIDLFKTLGSQKSVVAARSRIEDGQFVGWLSYVDVLTAQDAFLHLRDTFRSKDLTVKLYTRDERVPFDWYGAGHQPIMSHAS